MATYVIGDLQGCYATLCALLERVGYVSGRDRLWLVGDLVNRGPRSLEVLRWARREPQLVAVLGNHDLHLLACAAGLRQQAKRDTLDAILAAPEREELLDWLRARPLLVRQGGRLLVHAGLLPRWTPAEAQAYAREAEAALRGPAWREFLARLYAPRRQPDALLDAVSALTRLRVVDAQGRPEWRFKGPPAEAPAGLIPWFRHPARKARGVQILCGHWAALGLHRGPGVVALESGCVWGRELSALCLETGRIHAQPNCERTSG